MSEESQNGEELNGVPADAGNSSPFGDELGFVWPMRVDRNCRGGLLSVGGVVFDRGLGVHAPSRLTWDVGGEWSIPPHPL